jgi:hypothetical protein
VRLHLNGVVRSAHPLHESNAAGGPGSSIRLVTWHDLAIVVNELPDDHAPGEQDAMAYLQTLCALLPHGPVVPLRFGTIAQDENSARSGVLQPAAAQLRAQLDRLNGLAEIHVYLRFDENTALQAVYDEQEATIHNGRHSLADRIGAGEQIARRIVTWRRTRADTMLAPVSALAHDTAFLPEQEHTEERRAFLMPQQHIETARAAVASLTNGQQVAADLVGPLPAFSFLTATTNPSETAEAPASRWGW